VETLKSIIVGVPLLCSTAIAPPELPALFELNIMLPHSTSKLVSDILFANIAPPSSNFVLFELNSISPFVILKFIIEYIYIAPPPELPLVTLFDVNFILPFDTIKLISVSLSAYIAPPGEAALKKF
jgi:hypothetical protein